MDCRTRGAGESDVFRLSARIGNNLLFARLGKDWAPRTNDDHAPRMRLAALLVHPVCGVDVCLHSEVISNANHNASLSGST
jgi:hypothetical protein